MKTVLRASAMALTLFVTVGRESAALAQGNIRYNGGDVISNAKVQVIFWGPNVDSQVTQNIGYFYDSLLNSTYMDWLTEYNTPTQRIGHGALVPAGQPGVTINPTLYLPAGKNPVYESDIANELGAQFAAGKILFPDNDTVYAIHFPPGITLVGPSGNQSCQTNSFCAYHDNVCGSTGWDPVAGTSCPASQIGQGNCTNLCFAWVAMPHYGPGSCDKGCGDTGSSFTDLTTNASHEVAEAITNALSGWSDGNSGEIGDGTCQISTPNTGLISGYNALGQTNYTVQLLWSVKHQSCMSQDNSQLPMALTSYYDTATQTRWVFYIDNSGYLDSLSLANGQAHWYYLPLTSGIAPGSPLLVEYDGTYAHLYYIGTTGGIWEGIGTPPNSFSDISQASGTNVMPQQQAWSWTLPGHGALQGITEASTLAGFYDGRVRHVFYEGSDNTVRELYYDGRWWDHAIGVGTPTTSRAINGQGLAAVWDGSQEHVYFTNNSNPTAYATTFPEQPIGDLEQIAFPYNNNWTVLPLNSSPTYSPFGYLTAFNYVYSGTSYQYVLGGSTDLNTAQYPWGSNAPVPKNTQLNYAFYLSSLANGYSGYWMPTPAFDNSSPITSYLDAQNGVHLYYIGADGNVYYYPSPSSGNYFQLTTSTVQNVPSESATPAATSTAPPFVSPITGFYDPVYDAAFAYYINNQGHIIQVGYGATSGPEYPAFDLTADATNSVHPAAGPAQ